RARPATSRSPGLPRYAFTCSAPPPRIFTESPGRCGSSRYASSNTVVSAGKRANQPATTPANPPGEDPAYLQAPDSFSPLALWRCGCHHPPFLTLAGGSVRCHCTHARHVIDPSMRSVPWHRLDGVMMLAQEVPSIFRIQVLPAPGPWWLDIV